MKPASPVNKKKWKEGLKHRQQESHDRKDDSGMFKSIFKSSVPKDKFWQCSEDEHEINIIPYIAGKNNPRVEEGEPNYVLELFVHRQVGPANDNYICLDKTYGKACPICELRAKLFAEECEDEDLVKSLRPSKRVVYNIVCLDSPKEIKKGVQIYETSQYLFEKPMIEQATLPKGGGVILFSDPDDGKKVYFKKSGKGLKTDFTSFQFFDRKEEEEIVTDEILSAAFCLESLIHIPSYDEVYKALHKEAPEEGGEEEKPEDVPEPEKLKGKKKDEEEEGGEEEQSEEGEGEGVCPVGAVYATDYDKYEQCDECEVRDECKEANEKAKKPKVVAKREKEEAPIEKKAPEPKKPGIRKRPGR